MDSVYSLPGGPFSRCKGGSSDGGLVAQTLPPSRCVFIPSSSDGPALGGWRGGAGPEVPRGAQRGERRRRGR